MEKTDCWEDGAATLKLIMAEISSWLIWFLRSQSNISISSFQYYSFWRRQLLQMRSFKQNRSGKRSYKLLRLEWTITDPKLNQTRRTKGPAAAGPFSLWFYSKRHVCYVLGNFSMVFTPKSSLIDACLTIKKQWYGLYPVMLMVYQGIKSIEKKLG